MNRVLQRLLTFFAFGVVAVAPVFAQSGGQPGPGAVERYPSGSIVSLESAQEALDVVAAERLEIEARFVQEKAACMEKFFVTSCIDEAKERRRQALEPLTRVELEAKRFQRQSRALERDRELAERQARAAEKAAQAAAAEPRVKLPKPEPEPRPPAPPRPEQAHPVPTPEQEREAARERAENEAAYARKVQAAKERQEAVARRKAEKERKRAVHEADAVNGAVSTEGK